jgi:hypothetical protein
MSKNKKKRNKTYTGIDAVSDKPTITKISAVNRNKPAQWWYDNKKIAKPVLIIAGIAIFAALIIYELLRLVFGW